MVICAPLPNAVYEATSRSRTDIALQKSEKSDWPPDQVGHGIFASLFSKGRSGRLLGAEREG
jgi:hypothetical protein